MLIGGPNTSGRARVVRVLLAATGSLLAGLVVVVIGGNAGAWELPLRPSSPIGVALGFVAAVIVFFEMLLVPRKWFRGRRLGATKTWMRWHVWLGFASLPVVAVHAGFGFGGPLPAVTLALFLLVYTSGVWGLVLQQWLPRKLLTESPEEAVAGEIDRLAEQLGETARRVVAEVPTAPELTSFRDRLLIPYLLGQREGAQLRGIGSADREFDRLRGILPLTAHPQLDRLRMLVETRRRFDSQRWLLGWLHGWLVVHVPLSVAMTGLMVLHAVRALKYW